MKRALYQHNKLSYNRILLYVTWIANLVFIVLLIQFIFKFFPEILKFNLTSVFSQLAEQHVRMTLLEFWKSNLAYLYFLVIALNTLYFVIKIKQIPKQDRDKCAIVSFSKSFFLFVLITIAINQFWKRWIISQFMPEMTAVVVALGLLIFYS